MAKSDKSDSPNIGAFQPKKDFEDYLTNDFNMKAYRELTEDEDWKGTFKPLEFFNLFYEQVHFIEQHKTKPVTVKKHLESLNLNKKQHYYLTLLIRDYYWESEDKQLQLCLGFINGIVNELEFELYPPKETEPKPEPFDFKKDQEAANEIEDLQDRLLFLKQRKKEYDQYQAEGFNWDLGDKSKQYQLEIDHVQDLIKSQQQSKGKPGKAIQPIWWKKSDRLLKYLMDELARLDYIDRESPVNKHIKECFLNQHKNPFKASIAQNSSGVGANKGTSKNQKAKPKGHEEIDNLINSLKNQKDQSE